MTIALQHISKYVQFYIYFFKRLHINIVWDQHLISTFILLIFLQAKCHKNEENYRLNSEVQDFLPEKAYSEDKFLSWEKMEIQQTYALAAV